MEGGEKGIRRPDGRRLRKRETLSMKRKGPMEIRPLWKKSEEEGPFPRKGRRAHSTFKAQAKTPEKGVLSGEFNSLPDHRKAVMAREERDGHLLKLRPREEGSIGETSSRREVQGTCRESPYSGRTLCTRRERTLSNGRSQSYLLGGKKKVDPPPSTTDGRLLGKKRRALRRQKVRPIVAGTYPLSPGKE